MSLKNFKFNKKDFTFLKIKDAFLDFLLNRFGIIFMSIFLIASVLGGLIIYKYMYNFEWSDKQKADYRVQIENNKKVFVMSEFNNIIERIKRRKENKNADFIISKDIFGTDI